jgi:type II secretory pathway pseudopilin PulG
MKCCSEKMLFLALPYRKAFSLVEAVTALIILGLVCSSVLVVINRCLAGAADSELRMRAFEVARENMEKLLSAEAVAETSDYGESEKYPEIQWQTMVETFYEPLTARIWFQAICSAQYTDTEGDEQTIELAHWLTEVSKAQLIQMIKEGQEGASEPNEPSDPNAPSEPNGPSDPNGPKPPTPDNFEGVDCYDLAFCESVQCHIETGTPGRPTLDELIRYVNECME